MDLDQALALAERDRDRLLREREEIDAKVEDVDAEIDGLRRAMRRQVLSPQRPDPEAVADARRKFMNLPRTTAIELLLKGARSPQSPQVLTEMLVRMGRDDNYASVSAALAHLARTDRAHTIGRGNWLSGPAPAQDVTPNWDDDDGDVRLVAIDEDDQWATYEPTAEELEADRAAGLEAGARNDDEEPF